MIALDKENNITISQGDTFAIEFEVDEPLSADDTAVLSIKKGKETLLSVSASGSDKLGFVVSKENMARLEVGKYLYDLHFEFANGVRYTTDFVRRLEIVQVAHEV